MTADSDIETLRTMYRHIAVVDMLARRELQCNQAPLIQEQSKRLRNAIHIAIREQVAASGTEG
jgi:hypothetical protein